MFPLIPGLMHLWLPIKTSMLLLQLCWTSVFSFVHHFLHKAALWWASEVPNYGAYIRARVQSLPYFWLTKQHCLSTFDSWDIYFARVEFVLLCLLFPLDPLLSYVTCVSYVSGKLWKACYASWDSDALNYAAAALLVYLLVPTWLLLHKRSFGPVWYLVCSSWIRL
jgi:hypothetical protein